MPTPEELQIRKVIAMLGKINLRWVCQPADYVTPDLMCGFCKKHRLKPFDLECHNCYATIVLDMDSKPEVCDERTERRR